MAEMAALAFEHKGVVVVQAAMLLLVGCNQAVAAFLTYLQMIVIRDTILYLVTSEIVSGDCNQSSIKLQGGNQSDCK